MDNNACSMLCFLSLKSIDDVNMCKTKYLVYFIAIRSSVSKVLEKMIMTYVSLAIQGQQHVSKNKNI